MRKGRGQRMKVQKANMATWSNLPVDIFSQITSRLSSLEEVSRLSTVCKSWNSYVKFSEKPSLSLKTPVLMLVEEGETKGKTPNVKTSIEITELSTKFSVHVWRLKLSPPQKRCFGVNYGWLLTVGKDLEINLIHPMSEYQINLPPCPNSEYLLDPEYHGGAFDSDSDVPKLNNNLLWKAAMSSNPLENVINRGVNDECLVMGIFSNLGMLAFSKLKDKVWTIVYSDSFNFVDVIYFNGQFYSINNEGTLFVCDLSEDEPPMAWDIASVDEAEIKDEKFLVEVSGELFVVLCCYSSKEKRTMRKVGTLCPERGRIYMYRLVETESGYYLEKGKLGNSSVMLGVSSFSLHAPGIKGCLKRNKVFVADDNRTKPAYGMDVFDFGDVTSEGFNYSRLFKSISLTCPPFWYV